MSLLPGSGRHKGPGQAWVAVQHLIPAPTKNPRLIPGTINNTRREGVFYVVPWRQQADAIWTPARRAGSRRWTSSAVLHDGTGDLHHGQDKRTSPACCVRRDTTGVRQQAQGDAGQNQKATPGPGPARTQEADAGGQKRPPRAVSCKGVFERSLAAAYFPT